MSQAEELLNSISEGVPTHSHAVPDTDTYFVIDPITRKIENTNRKKSVIMQYDHNSERFTFELPRYVDGHDMLECTSVTVNVDNIETGVEEPRVNSDAPDMTDLRVHPNNQDKVISSWLISRNSTQLAGILSFHIEYKCTDSDGNVVYEWSTDTYDEIEVRARKKNGEAAVIEHSDLLEQWRTRIFGAGDSVMANIATEGEAQVAAVKAESETQQEAVELKGAQTLDTIPEDYTEVDAMADEAVRSKGDAIVCEASGESIVLKDSSDDYIRGLKLFGKSKQRTTTGKNLLPFSYKDLSKTENGVTLTVNGDGSISFSGTAKGYAGIPLYEGYASVFPNVITIFALGVFSNAVIHIVLVDKNGSTILETNLTSAMPYRTIDFSQYADIERITINAKRYDAGAVSGTIYPMIVSGEMNSATYEPYTGGMTSPNPDYPQDIVSIENPTVVIAGKNLLNNVRYTTTQDGVTFTVNDDKTVVLNGTATADVYFYLTDDTMLSPGTYRLSGAPLGSSTSTYYMYVYPDYHSDQHGTGYTFEVKEPGVYSARIYVKKDTVCTNVLFKPQIEIGTETTAYEPYAGGSIEISHTLPGIPVTSGGNYTDENGQQWICDEVNLERGVYIQRVGVLRLEGSANWTTYTSEYGHYGFMIWHALNDTYSRSIGLCNQLPNVGSKSDNCVWVGVNDDCLYVLTKEWYDKGLAAWKAHLNEKPFEIAYVRNTPIETPLTAEEITAFKALKTNYPNTTILNDAGAWMSVKYNADTKSYVENPKTLKLVDSSTGVVYELKVVDGNLTVSPIE